MDYLSLYRKVVEKQNEDTLLHLLKETGHWEKLQAIDFEIIDDTTLPYILITVDYQEDVVGYFASAMIGISLEKSYILDIQSNYNKEYFYLPLIAKPQTYPEIAKKYYSEEHAIQHELMHISDILQWIENDPTYIENVLHYSYETATEDTLDKSIDFEVQKIFTLEPQAMGHDFDNGEDMIIEPFLFGLYMRYKCPTKTEYIEIKIADYMSNLKEMYVKNFSQKKEAIEHFFEESVGKYGKNVFGHDPYHTLQHVHKDKVDKMLTYSVETAMKSKQESKNNNTEITD